MSYIFQFDPAVQRYNSMRANHWDTFRATPKTAAFGFFVGVAPILLLWWKMEKDKASTNLKHFSSEK